MNRDSDGNKTYKNKKRKPIKWVLAIFVAVVTSLALFIKEPSHELFMQGVVISFIASLLFFVYTSLFDDSTSVILERFDNLDEKADNQAQLLISKFENSTSGIIESIDNVGKKTDNQARLLNTVIQSEDKRKSYEDNFGIINVLKREPFHYEFWRELLKVAEDNDNDHLTLTGRSLGRWMEEPLRPEFIRTLKNLAENNKKITLVLYKDSVLKEKEKGEKRDLKKILYENVFPIIKKKYSSYDEATTHFSIKEVDLLPYIFNSVKSRIVASQYFQYSKNEENLLFVLKPDSHYARQYQADLNQLIKKNGSDNDWLKKFYEKYQVN